MSTQTSVEPDDGRFVVSDIQTLKAVAEPLRMRLLLDLEEGPKTVKELAGSLDVPQTRLYYHVRILERHGLMRVASTRMVSGIEERRYETTASNWTLAPSLMADPAVSDLLKAMFDLTRTELVLAFGQGGPPPGDPKGLVPILSFTRWFLTLEDAEEVQRRVIELFVEYGSREPRPGAFDYRAAFCVYRVEGPAPAGQDHAS
jgi:DNA-binding transcriptional ArsR family regulator